jgi:predicted  nucleic acid-binding Zn-ribbon protein
MTVETLMYFALGFLIASVLALMILPQVWKRAVRLTTKRIEAATPITLAEFRADKDQLRAEFALSTRRLEMNVETLRRRLASQLNDVNRKKTDLAVAKTEREAHLQIVRELEEREADARRRILELEKDGADLSQRLRMRDREYADKLAQLEAMRDAMQNNRPAHFTLNGKALSGIYNTDIEALLSALATERARAEFLDSQTRTLIAQLEAPDRRGTDAVAPAQLHDTLAATNDAATQASNELVAAEARIADAENRLNSLLSEAGATPGERLPDQLLADRLKLEDQIERLKGEVLGVEGSVMADWDTDRIESAKLREKLNDIASDVSRIVYALDGNAALDSEESLFDRVQKFAGGGDTGTAPAIPASAPVTASPSASAKPVVDKSTRVSAPSKSRSKKAAIADRLTALRDLQRRH